jgi:hypothetical protein
LILLGNADDSFTDSHTRDNSLSASETLDAEWEEVQSHKKTGFLLLSVGSASVVCATLFTLVFLTSSKLPAPVRVASHRPEALKSRITIPTEHPQPAYVFAQSGGTTLRKTASESSLGDQQAKDTNPPLVDEVAELHGSFRSDHAKRVSNGPPQSPGLGAANQEDDSVEVPGKVLKELVPGYETREIQGFKMLLSTQAIKEGKKDGSSPEFVGKFLAFRPPISLQGKEGKYCLQRRGVICVSVS